MQFALPSPLYGTFVCPGSMDGGVEAFWLSPKWIWMKLKSHGSVRTRISFISTYRPASSPMILDF